MAKAKEGVDLPDPKDVKPLKTRKRKKTFATMMCLHNMLRLVLGLGLEKFWIRRNEDGDYPEDPFNWCSLDLALDQASDNVCMDNLLSYECGVNLNVNYDLAHGGHNDVKQALKDCNLWRHEVAMASAPNCYYGSMLSPPRLKCMRELILEYMRLGDPETDAWFLFHVPHILHQMGLEKKPSDDGVATWLWHRIMSQADEWAKGRKLNFGDYMEKFTEFWYG